MREAEWAKAEAIDELAREKRMYETAFSQVTMKLNNIETKLEQARHRAEIAFGEAEGAKQEVEQIKIDIEVWVTKERKEVESDIYSAFIFTLWKTHSELDFFCFGDEAVEAVKKYVADAASKEVAEALTALKLIEVDPLAALSLYN